MNPKKLFVDLIICCTTGIGSIFFVFGTNDNQQKYNSVEVTLEQIHPDDLIKNYPQGVSYAPYIPYYHNDSNIDPGIFGRAIPSTNINPGFFRNPFPLKPDQ